VSDPNIAAAKIICRDLLKTSWDGLRPDYRITEHGYESLCFSSYGGWKCQGGQTDLLDIVAKIAATLMEAHS
jgi:hypothetical protein